MAPAPDLDLAIGARLIANGNIDDPQVQFGGAEEQIEVAEVAPAKSRFDARASLGLPEPAMLYIITLP